MESGGTLGAILLISSGVFYLICALFLWKPFRQEKNELVSALFAFLAYQAVGMFFMGLEMQTMNMTYGYISTLAVFIGSAYMLKFPFSSFSWLTRKLLFYFSIAAVVGLFVWFMQTPERQKGLMNFTLWYDIVVNGIFVGGSIIFFGLSARGWARFKTLGGGTGVVSCCIVSNAAMLGGAILTSSVFQFAAPVIILSSLAIARKKQ